MAIYAAIGIQHNRLVVWGLGSTPEAAEEQAYSQAAPTDPMLIRTVPVTEDQAERIRAGEVLCAALGLLV